MTQPYVALLEDDWIVRPYQFELAYYLQRATDLLARDPGVMQVRIPRWSNEKDRIRALPVKHGLDGRVQDLDAQTFAQTDYSNHPSIMRTRDLRAALTLVMRGQVPAHSEHGMGQALKMLSWTGGAGSGLPFVCFEPHLIRCGHLGTLPGEEDDLNQPLLAT